jgi:hypothetical protein
LRRKMGARFGVHQITNNVRGAALSMRLLRA